MDMTEAELLARWNKSQDSDPQIEAGAQALMKAFPGLCEDFTQAWFHKAAKIVLEAANNYEQR